MLREELKSKIKDLRSLEYLLEQAYTVRAEEQFTESEKRRFDEEVKFVMACSEPKERLAGISRVRELVKRKLVENQSLNDLKALAYQMGIPRYSRLDRDSLVREINARSSNGSVR